MLSDKRVLNLLNNDIGIAEIGQAVLELLRSKFVTGNRHKSQKIVDFKLFELPIGAENDLTFDK